MSETRTDQLELFRKVREGRHPKRPLDFGELQLSIPEQDFRLLVMAMPELMSSDPDESTRAWDAFLASPLSEPYRVVRSRLQIMRSDPRVQVR